MNGRIAAIVVIIALLAVVIANATFEVLPNNQALVLQFGRIVGDDYGPGLHFKIPFVQDVQIYDGRILTLDNQTQTFATADKKNFDIGYYAKWQIVDPDTYYRAAGGQQIVAMNRLSSLLDHGLSDEFAKVSHDEAVAADGRSLMKGLGAETMKKIKALGIRLVDLRISKVQLPADMLKSVYAHMKSEREAQASKTREAATAAAEKTRASADAKASQVLSQAHLKAARIRGKGDAKVAQIYASAHAEDPAFFNFHHALESYKKALSKGGNVLVLTPDGPFFKYLKHGADGQ